MVLQCGRFSLPLDSPLVMCVLNVTPDSFSDGGRYPGPSAAAEYAQRMFEDGAAIIDVGGESTRPGAKPVSEQEELDRIMPVLERLAGFAAPISVDTRRTGIMREVLAAGASMINDVDALSADGALALLAGSGAAVCLMHKQGDPARMQDAPYYRDVVAEVRGFLAERVDAARAAGIGAARIAIDAGFGFGKNLEHNLALLRGLPHFCDLGVAVLAGVSRKSMLERITGRPVGERLAASIAAALLAVQGGARIVRVHDVAETRDALAVWSAVRGKA
ncbi:MAG: dihydropteroate synthase [Betaproteobacteria bacterium]|nr:dihydropteroate synthase [Betaproteobacteria bacterium]